MARVLILVEGETEELFVRRILEPHLAAFELYVRATRIATKIIEGRRAYRGGHGRSYQKFRRDLQRLLGDSDAKAITTLIDYYGLPRNFPGLDTRPSGNCYQRVAHVEQCFADDLRDERFTPHLILHEFEALLFSAPDAIVSHFPTANAAAVMSFFAAIGSSPEEVNDDPNSSPAHRIRDILPQYDKVADGPIIASNIGLQRIRQHCPHFDAWITRLENLGAR